jgi:4-amino-4-deoxy-L-arabinose transferase-like glycosyltransferase
MKSHRFILSGIFLLTVLVRVICFVGLIGSDDLSYNRNAYTIAIGTYTPTPHHQNTRLGIFLPVAVCFKLLGVNELSSVVFPFMCAILIFWVLVYCGTRYFGRWTGVIAGLLYAFFPIEIFHATQLLTDLPSAACVALSAVMFLSLETSNTAVERAARRQRLSWLYGLSAGVLLGWAFLIRETTIFFTVFLLGYMGYQRWVQKTIRASWLWFWLGCALVFGAEAGYFYHATGNPFYRYASVEAGHNLSLFAGSQLHGLVLLRRLTLDPFRFLLDIPNFGFSYFFILAGTIAGLRKRPAHLTYFLGWFLTLFLLFDFGSTSLSAYSPLLLFHRFFLALTVPGVIIMSWYLQEMSTIFTADQHAMAALRFSLVIPWFIMFIINIVWFSIANTVFLVGMIPIILLTVVERLRATIRLRLSPRYVAIVPTLCLVYLNIIPGLYTSVNGAAPLKGISCERQIRPALEFPLTHTIYTDSRTEAILEYYYQYQADSQIKQFTETDPVAWKQAYLVINWKYLYFLNRLYHTPIPDFVFHPLPQWKLYATFRDEWNTCVIYEAP